MSKINLIINLYVDKNADRQKELETVFQKNFNNTLIDTITCIVQNNYEFELYSLGVGHLDKLDAIILPSRPTFNDYFKLTKPDYINIIANGDIYFDNTLSHVKNHYWGHKQCLALSRWDVNPSGFEKFLDNIDSQDVWVLPGHVSHIEGADFTLGTAGCDNRIAYLLHKSGYSVFNPGLDIKSYHLHNSQVLNYVDSNGQPRETVRSPYVLLRHCRFEDVKSSFAEKFYEHRP